MRIEGNIACLAGGFGRAGSKVLAAKPREEWEGSGLKNSRVSVLTGSQNKRHGQRLKDTKADTFRQQDVVKFLNYKCNCNESLRSLIIVSD